MNYIKIKKRLGQHFLKNKSIIDRIVEIGEVKKDDIVLEIGPGLGHLTSALVEKAKQIIAVEKDRELTKRLKEKFSEKENIEIINQDILKFNFQHLIEKYGNKNIKVISNIPYNISTEIIFTLLKHKKIFKRLVLMLQKEVAERITAISGKKDYGVLSVLTQTYTETKIKLHISRKNFFPEPKVDSAIVEFKFLPIPKVDNEIEDFFKRVVRAAFSQRRKKLINALKAGMGFSDEKILEALDILKIKTDIRGERLSVDDFILLSKALSKKP